MEGHRLRVGALAWSSSMLSSGSRDKSILQRDIRTQDDFVSKLAGHKSEVGFLYIQNLRSIKSIGRSLEFMQPISFSFSFSTCLLSEVQDTTDIRDKSLWVSLARQ